MRIDTHASPELALFAGVFIVLVIATVIGRILKSRLAADADRRTVDNLNARVNTWWIMVALIAFSIASGETGVIILFALISFQCLREFISLTYTRRADYRALLWTFFFFLPLQYYLIAIEWYGLFSILIPVYAFLLLPISASLGKDTTRFLERSAKLQWALMICVYCLSHVPALLTLEIPGYANGNTGLVLFLIVVVQSSDVFQYIWGKLLGKRKLAPEVSPSKTWEGLIGGVATASALGAALWWLTPFTPLQAGAVALCINILGFFGGLVLSAIKRDRGVKDWGSLIEGHGGMLDRVDSISFAAPVFFHILRYWWTP